MAKTSTKQLITIENIIDDIILLKDGSLRSVVEVFAINFELRSEDEQTGILQNFQRFLNSLDFPIQIVTSSRKLDLTPYLALLDKTAETLENELLKVQAMEYSKFVSELSTLANIMSKAFFIVVPFYVFENPSRNGFLPSIKTLIGLKSNVKKIDQTTLDSYKVQMTQRTELIADGLIGLGLKTKILDKNKLLKLFYQAYNPSSGGVFKQEESESQEY